MAPGCDRYHLKRDLKEGVDVIPPFNDKIVEEFCEGRHEQLAAATSEAS